MPFVTANGGNFYYEIDDFTDPWSKPETVWIQHGVGRSGWFWQHWVPVLVPDYCIIRRDQRGHGRSPDPGNDLNWSMDDLLRDMVEFLDVLGLDSVHYVGESMGAVLGVTFAARWPDRVKNLTLCSMPVDLRPPRNDALRVGYADSAPAKRDLGPAGWAREMIKGRVISGGSTAGNTKWVIEGINKTPLEVLVRIGLPLYSPEANVADLLDGLRVPTLVLAPSTKSPITSLEEQIWIRDTIPNARIAIVDGQTHEINVDRPLDCLAAVKEFLANVGPRGVYS